MTPDPYAPHLRQADELFSQGQTVKAGQIWQAILKQQPSHAEAREKLLAVKQRLLALREAEAAASASPPVAEPTPIPFAPEPAPPISTPEATSLPPASESTPPAPQPIRVSPAPREMADATSAPSPVAEAVPAPPEPERAQPAPEPAPPPPASDPVPPAPQPIRVGADALDPERLVTEGCTLYDMGQTEDALGKWEQTLTLDPAHVLARGYANGARQELGMAPLPASTSVAPTPLAAHPADEDIDKLLREAVQLYDMGLVEEAITKWERVLLLEPQRQEIEGYLRQARTEVGLGATGAPAPVTVQAAAASGALDLKLRQGEHLLTLQRQEEAAFTFQQALALDPGNARAREGLERCRKPGGQAGPGAGFRQAPALSLDAQGRIAMAVEEAHPPTEPQGVEPPAALLKAAPAPREGLSLPDRMRKTIERLPWLKDPRVLAGLGGSVLVLALGFSVIHSYRKDQALKGEVQAARAAAVAPVAQQAGAPDLMETPESIHQEAEAALGTDPLRAYLRAEALVGRNANDAAGAQLLEKARAGLPGGVTGASLPEFKKHLQNGDLEAALKVMDTLLRAQPGDADLRARAGRLDLALCSAHANQAKWEEAREDLLRGRALFPADKTWQTRLKLLERVKTLPKNQQAAWIPLLG